ncbi:hypothetical protein [Emergencia timonensis]|uniref:hypothetical protein n=1 Tax=Emergencia timonensis TaxID=1776384 RepID=UPI0039942945
MLRVRLDAVAVKAVVVRVLHVQAAVGVDQDVTIRVLAHAVAVLAALVAAVVVDALAHAAVARVHVLELVVAAAVAADARAHVEDARLAVHVQIYVQADARAHAMQGAAAAVRRLVCHRVRAHVLRLVQGSRQYQLLLIKGRYRYEN